MTRFVWKRKWPVVILVVLFTTAANLMAYSQPLRYRSETLMAVVPPQVPEGFVQPTVTAHPEEWQSAMEAVMSRTRLEKLVLELNLYKEERRTAVMQDVIEQMRRDITTLVEGNAVRIAYEGVNAHAVQVVTMRLADLFIDENRRMGSRLAENTSDFLDGSVADLATKVNELSERVEQIQKAQRTPPRSLMVEYEELQNRYRAMLAKSEDARMAADLEERKTGEQFQVLEPASPGRRVNHDYLTMSLYGAAAGLGLGLALLLVLSLRRGRVSPEPL